MNNKTDSREKILTTASRLFQLKGYNATGLNEILKESSSPKGSLYYYFPNGKEELAVEAIKLASEAIAKSIRTALGKYLNPIKAMQYNIKTIIEELNSEDGLQDISISLLSLETHLLSEQLREACKKAIIVMETIYTEKLIESGFNKEKAEELGMVINLMIEGAITVSVTKRDVSALLVVSNQIELLLNN
ncbi:TetR/AcrR family transcriptional regulator [Clostridium tagluense]|uniref:TetR/AcrR family transcriptional regulator n=1 Tax=Clostridium tagluense TaxID=360422 RepID=UPI001CF5E430|nr:TetR/AcrR family transcriptional regulator [Clostridium tagluense]MCB2310235.1 TetR/AcrR family transcriptional regulator [Clostridium tagluense]MCB2315123.1 TetR/AcrR family transcriptional regulator [Clostridium tagluense]MCB2319935.1 TetR/AcrR family transcriptional regulator [Clostridium tagluense]MCB2324866.1 TetR/AcrR family transcriptional regulator [Clostridium tagluense]MCB2329680.1 TetR/AcrR family transcriptional regulator [Clostridium tagluense]